MADSQASERKALCVVRGSISQWTNILLSSKLMMDSYLQMLTSSSMVRSLFVALILRLTFNFNNYIVPNIVHPGQTLSSTKYERRAGGKGANQAVAIAKAGGTVSLCGAIASDGTWMLGPMSKLKIGMSGLLESRVRNSEAEQRVMLTLALKWTGSEWESYHPVVTRW